MSIDLAALKAELTTDPLGRGYAGMTDNAAAYSLNFTIDRAVPRSTMEPTEVMNAVDVAEWNALTDAAQRKIWDVLHMGTINPFGIEQTIFVSVFGGGSTTISNLAAARTTLVSRANELFGAFVSGRAVADARAL